jgi:GntR family transcriptional regulator
MLKFNLDKNVGLKFYDQIKGQLLSAIYCGKIDEGERLPPMRELSDALGINYKTVQKIYQRLALENLVEIVQGSGAFLKKRTSQHTFEDMRRQAIVRHMQDVTEKAKGLGLSPQRFVRILDNYVSGTNLTKLRLAVVDHPEEAFIFSRELRTRVHAEVNPIPLTEGHTKRDEQILQESDYLLTTSYHMGEVEELARKVGKRVLEIKPSHQIYTEVLTAAQDKNIAIVIQDERTMHASWEVFMQIYHPSTQKKFWIAPIARKDLIENIVEEADLIFVSPMCWDEMRKLTPAEKALKTYDNFISSETIDRLKELQLLA